MQAHGDGELQIVPVGGEMERHSLKRTVPASAAASQLVIAILSEL